MPGARCGCFRRGEGKLGEILGKGSAELEAYRWPLDGRVYGPKSKPRVDTALLNTGLTVPPGVPNGVLFADWRVKEVAKGTTRAAWTLTVPQSQATWYAAFSKPPGAATPLYTGALASGASCGAVANGTHLAAALQALAGLTSVVVHKIHMIRNCILGIPFGDFFNDFHYNQSFLSPYCSFQS
jgi:hypothetical protein